MARRSSIFGMCTAIAGMLAIAACGTEPGAPETDTTEGASEEVPTGDALVEAAEEEGSVVFYAGLNDEASVEQVKVFEEKYPNVDVELLLIGGEEQFSRVMQEHTAGVKAADLVAGSDYAHFLVYQEEGMVLPYISVEHESILDDYKDDEGAIYSPYVSRYAMAHNPDIIAEADAPKSWMELGDPKWHGEIVTSTPTTSAIAGIVPYVLTTAVYDNWDLFEKMGKNEPLLLASTNDVFPAVATGERAIAFVVSYEGTVMRQNEGEAIAPLFPEEGVVVVKPGMSIMKDAQHPNAARLLEDFLLGQEAQEIFTDIVGRSPTRADVEPVSGTVPLGEEGVNLLQVDYEGYADHLGEVRQQFDRYMAGR